MDPSIDRLVGTCNLIGKRVEESKKDIKQFDEILAKPTRQVRTGASFEIISWGDVRQARLKKISPNTQDVVHQTKPNQDRFVIYYYKHVTSDPWRFYCTTLRYSASGGLITHTDHCFYVVDVVTCCERFRLVRVGPVFFFWLIWFDLMIHHFRRWYSISIGRQAHTQLIGLEQWVARNLPHARVFPRRESPFPADLFLRFNNVRRPDRCVAAGERSGRERQEHLRPGN